MNDIPRPTISLPARIALTVLMLVASLHASAVALGEAIAVSTIGAPLKVEITAAGSNLSRVGECLKLAAGSSEDGLPWVREGRIRVTGRGSAARIVISGTAPMFEPIVRLGVEDVCDAQLRREYTLFLPFPEAHGEAGAPTSDAATPPPIAAERARAAVPAPEVVPLAPLPTKARRRRLSPPVGTQQAQVAAQRPAPAIAASARPDADDGTGDRLTLAPDSIVSKGLRLSTELASVERIGRTTGAERDRLRRERAVVMAIDRSIVTQLELNERIRQLEDLQAAMSERVRALPELAGSGGPAAASPPPPLAPSATPTDGWLFPLMTFSGLSLSIAAGLLWVRKRRNCPESDLDTLTLVGPLTGEASDPPEAEPVPAISGESPAAPSNPEREPPQWLASGLATAEVLDEAVQEHQSAIELAELMIGLGRVQGAAATLAEYIHTNPKKAVTPWLKLLEVYRAAGLRPEFDSLALQLNKTFNVKSVTWDTFDEARKSGSALEQMPHVMENVHKYWRTRDCQAYLERLLRDNRDGTRQGFPLKAVDEILVLAAILEEELGPYAPAEATGFSSAAA